MFLRSGTISFIAAVSVVAACSNEEPTPFSQADAAGPDARTISDARTGDPDVPVTGIDAGEDPDSGGPDAEPADVSPIATVLTLVGSSPLARATIRGEVAGEVYTTIADEDGSFVLEIDSEQVDPLVVLYARGAAARNETHYELASISRSVSALTALAGDDLIVGTAEEGTLELSEFSTVRYAVMYAAAGGAVPATHDELITAELVMPEPLWSYEMSNAAAMLRAILSGGESLGTPATTLELMRDLYSVVDRIDPYFNDYYTLANELVAEPRSLGAFEASELSRHFVDFLVHRGPWVGAAGARWDFDPSGRGVADDGILGAILRAAPFSWSIDQEGAIEVVLDTPAPGQLDLPADQILALISDPAEHAVVQNLLQGAGATVFLDVLRIRIMRIAGFEHVDWVVRHADVRWKLNESFAQFRITVTDVEGPRASDTEIWTRADDLPAMPFTLEDAADSWILRVQGTTDLGAIFDQFQPGDPWMVDTRVHLDPNGSGLIEGGFNEPPLTVGWGLQSDGRVLITYPDSMTQAISWLTDQTMEQGLLHELTLPSGDVFMHYRRAVRIDPQLELSENLLITRPGNYWQTTLSTVFDHPKRDGTYPAYTIYGYSLPGGEDLDIVSFAGPGLPVRIDQTWSATISAGKATFEQRYDRSLANRCSKTDPSCFARRRRTWEPVAFDGTILYVLEKETWISEWEGWTNRYSWSDVRNAWVHNTTGQIMNPDQRVYFIPPRLNAYYVNPIP